MTLEEINREREEISYQLSMSDPYESPENFYEDGELNEEEAQSKFNSLNDRLYELDKMAEEMCGS